MAWPDKDVELEAAEREVAHWLEIYNEQSARLLEIERSLSRAIERRDAALTAADACT